MLLIYILMTRTHPNITFMAEIEQFLSEKTTARGGVTTVTLMSDAGFVARNLTVYGGKVMLG